MKRIKLFEEFNEIEELNNEGFNVDGLKGVKKFFTGHKDKEEKEGKKEVILAQIDKVISGLNKAGWIKDENVEKTKQNLIKQAEDNNWKGTVKSWKYANNTWGAVYNKGRSSFQDIGLGAAGAGSQYF